MREIDSTIRFTARLSQSATLGLPDEPSAMLPPGRTLVEGTMDAFPFRAPLEGGVLQLNAALCLAAGVDAGDTVTVEITRIGEEPEIRMPADLREALGATPPAQACWAKITPMARRDWILWISTAKQEETRARRIEKARDMLASGKKRVCCFGCLNWLTKDHEVETWVALPEPVR
jgi:hypothetical protein